MAMIFLSGLAMSSYFLALCYMLMTFMGISKLCSNKNLSYSRTTQLLMVSVSLGCLFRAATFSTLCFLDFQHTESGLSPLSSPVHVPEVTAPEESDLSFYNKVVAVLFNLPDYLFVSSYLLVVLLWAETYQSSRRHWFSAEQFHRRWMIFYLIFNGLLYLTQVVLYALLFLRADPSAIAGIYENEEGTQLALVPTLIFGLCSCSVYDELMAKGKLLRVTATRIPPQLSTRRLYCLNHALEAFQQALKVPAEFTMTKHTQDCMEQIRETQIDLMVLSKMTKQS
ncbi:hypothetical protein DYB25_010404, partial [Aphanomyces astaci]